MAGLDDFELLPVDDDLTPAPEDALNAAVASALGNPEAPVEAPDDAPPPFGYSWAFDWNAGRFVRQGAAPARVSGVDAFRERCLMAVNSARFAHAVFSRQWGVDIPQHAIGAAGDAAVLAASDWQVAIRDALLAVERCADASLTCTYDPVAGQLTVTDLVVVTDEDDTLQFDDLMVKVEG